MIKKILIVILFTFSLQAEALPSLFKYDLENPKNKTKVLNLQEQLKYTMKWIDKLPLKEQTNVLMIYRTIFEKLAQEITKKLKGKDTEPMAKYTRIIGVSNLLIRPYVNNPEFRDLLEKEVKTCIQYISNRLDDRGLVAKLNETNEIKTKLLKDIGAKEFNRLKISHQKHFDESTPLFLRIILLTELKVVSDKDIKEFFKQ